MPRLPLTPALTLTRAAQTNPYERFAKRLRQPTAFRRRLVHLTTIFLPLTVSYSLNARAAHAWTGNKNPWRYGTIDQFFPRRIFDIVCFHSISHTQHDFHVRQNHVRSKLLLRTVTRYRIPIGCVDVRL